MNFNYSILEHYNDVFVQIGTNTGDDLFRDLVVQYRPKRVILIDPLADEQNLFPVIKNNYQQATDSEITVVNSAIVSQEDKNKPDAVLGSLNIAAGTTDNEQSFVSLYIPAKDGVYGQPGVQPDRVAGNHTYSHEDFSLLPMNDWGDKQHLLELKTTAMTLDDICQKYQISHINYLHINTCGYDSEIIKSIDFVNPKFPLDIIRYHKNFFGEGRFTKYHSEKSHLYGTNGMNDVEKLLSNHNYQLIDAGNDTLGDFIAIKNDIRGDMEKFEYLSQNRSDDRGEGGLKSDTIDNLEPGNIYLFSGLQTLHSNFAVNEDYVRATLLCFYGNPYPDSKILNWVKRTRHNQEDKNVGL